MIYLSNAQSVAVKAASNMKSQSLTMNVEATSKENGVSATNAEVWEKYKVRSKHDQQAKKNKFRQHQDEMDWVVRHCSPDIIVYHPTDADWGRNQSDPFGFSDWCAPVDWRCVRLKDTD